MCYVYNYTRLSVYECVRIIFQIEVYVAVLVQERA